MNRATSLEYNEAVINNIYDVRSMYVAGLPQVRRNPATPYIFTKVLRRFRWRHASTIPTPEEQVLIFA
jgi:hypothetical protein